MISDSDPDLARGFPMKIGAVPGGNLGPNLMLGDIDGDKAEEIIVQTFGGDDNQAQVYALKSNGDVVPGWPVTPGKFPRSMAMGKISKDSPGLDTILHLEGKEMVTPVMPSGKGNPFHASVVAITAFSGSGKIVQGWPSGQYVAVQESDTRPYPNLHSLPVVADLDRDGIGEILTDGFVFRGDGSTLFNWPARGNLLPLSVGDLDGDGYPELVFDNNGLTAFHHDGSPDQDFAATSRPDVESASRRPVIGDIDGDGSPEVITVTWDHNQTKPAKGVSLKLDIFSNKGVLKHEIPFTDTLLMGSEAVALGDLNCDGTPEIIAQTDDRILAWKGDGTLLLGWPQPVYHLASWSAPLVGDVDGDGRPDIVTFGAVNASNSNGLLAYHADGHLLPGFPKVVNGLATADIAVGDLYGDGRNEIVVASTQSIQPGVAGNNIWVYDLRGKGPYGKVHWGQFAGGPQHQGYYASDGTECVLH